MACAVCTLHTSAMHICITSLMVRICSILLSLSYSVLYISVAYMHNFIMLHIRNIICHGVWIDNRWHKKQHIWVCTIHVLVNSIKKMFTPYTNNKKHLTVFLIYATESKRRSKRLTCENNEHKKVGGGEERKKDTRGTG
jgi:hypothetical protein